MNSYFCIKTLRALGDGVFGLLGLERLRATSLPEILHCLVMRLYCILKQYLYTQPHLR